MAARSASSKVPPPFADGDDYDVWKKDLELWQFFTDLDAKKQAIAVHLSLTGRARSATSELSVNDLKGDDAMKLVIAKLDRVFALDKNWKCFHAYLNFENLSRGSECSVDEYLSEFDRRYHKLKECEVTLPDAVLACRLLKSCALSDVHFQLALSTTAVLTFENMRATLKKLFTDSSPTKTEDSTHAVVKVENDVFYGKSGRGYQQLHREAKNDSRSSSSGHSSRQTSDVRVNPLNSDGTVSLCAICASKMHWAKDCPHAYERKPKTVFYGDRDNDEIENEDPGEEVNITLMAQADDSTVKMDLLLGETMGKVLLDSGCSKTVCGEAWLDSFMDTLTTNEKSGIVYDKCSAVYRFGDGERVKAEKSVILPCVLAGKRIKLKTDVVSCTLPLLLSKSSMKKAEMVLNLNDDTATVFGEKVKLGITSLGHYTLPVSYPASTKRIEYILMNEVAAEDNHRIATKLHKQFAHPTSDKLKKFLLGAGRNDQLLLKAIDEVTEKCETCIKYKRQRPRPVVALSMGNVFNETVAMDLKVWKQGLYFFVVVDVATRFCRATVITDKSPKTIIRELFCNWISLFGAPKKFLSDNGGEFNNEIMRELSDNFGINLVCTAAQSPWSNGVCERLNAILGSSVCKVMNDADCSLHVALSWAVAARNSLHNCHGYSPNQLVFGMNPSLPNVIVGDGSLLEKRTKSRMIADNLNAMHAARVDFIKNESNEKLRRALLHQLRSSDMESLCNGDKVYFKRNESCKWQGPGVVIGKDGKQVLVRHGGTYIRAHTCRLQRDPSSDAIDKIDLSETEGRQPVGVPAENSDDECSDVQDSNSGGANVRTTHEDNDSHERNTESTQAVIGTSSGSRTRETSKPKLKKGDVIEYTPVGSDVKLSAKVIGRAGKATGVYGNCFNIQSDEGDIRWIDFERGVKEWSITDPSSNTTLLASSHDSSKVTEAKIAEMENWKRNGVYEEVIDDGQPTVSVRWVVTEKVKDGDAYVKARLVLRGFEEDLEDLPTDSPTCAKDTLRVALSVISMNNWTCNSLDVKAAFLQGDPIDRDVYIKPPKPFFCGNLWKLKKTVYGLCDAARSWYLRVKHELIKSGMVVSKLDQALFLYFTNGILSGIVCLHVDDMLWSGTEEFQNKVISDISEKFQIGSTETGIFKYVGVNVSNADNFVGVDQKHYIQTLQEVTISSGRSRSDDLTPEERKEYRSIVGQLNWVATQTRPDILFEVCMLSSRFDSARIEDLMHANKVIRKVKASAVTLKFSNLQENQLSIECYSDASFGNLKDGGSQGGYVIFISDTDGNRCPVSWQSKRVRRVVKSTLAAETLAALDAAQAGVYISTLLAEVLNMTSTTFPVKCYVDNRSLVESLHSTKSVEDKHLRINMSVLRDMLSTRSLSTVSWVKTSHQLANVLTKQGACHRPLLSAIGESLTRH